MANRVPRGKITYALSDGSTTFRWIELRLDLPMYRGEIYLPDGARIIEQCYQLYDPKNDPIMHVSKIGEKTDVTIDDRERCPD